MAESEKTQLPTRSRCARRGIDRDVRRVASSTLDREPNLSRHAVARTRQSARHVECASAEAK